MARRPSGLKGGSTNLTCRHCNSPIDGLEMVNVSPDSITPDTLFNCPYCGNWFYPEIGLLHSLFQGGEVEDVYFGRPLSLGGRALTNFTGVKVGETRPVPMHNLHSGYEYEAVFLKGANRKGVEKEDYLDFDLAGGYNRANLGEDVLVTLVKTESTNLAINASLHNDTSNGGSISTGDELDIIYTATLAYGGVTNPPWIDLLVEAQSAIREDLPLSALPLLRSAVDNCLIRQAYLYLVWNRSNSQIAHEEVMNFADEGYDPNRIDIAKTGLKELSGERLTDGPYDTLWAEFSKVVNERDSIIHSEMESRLNPPDQDSVKEFYDTTVSLLVATYDLLWNYNTN